MYELVVRPSSDSEIATCVEAALCIERAVSVSLTSSNSAVTVPATVTVQANATAAQFTANISSVLTTASSGSSSMNVPLQLSAVILIPSVNRTSVAFQDAVVNTSANAIHDVDIDRHGACND